MRTKFYPLLTVAVLAVCIVILTTCKSNPPFVPCPPEGERPAKPECCQPTLDSALVPDKVTVIDTSDFEWETALRCPCDPTLIELDSSRWTPDEENQSAMSSSPPESEPIFNFPIPRTFGREFRDTGRTPADNLPDDVRIKVAILDSGLDDEILEQHAHEISRTMNMFTFDDDVSDEMGHGTAIFTVIDAHAQFRAQYSIYKCIGDDGYATSFSIACALKCAKAEGVDVINVSLGSYKHNELLRNIIDGELSDVAIIGSRGNDCTVEESRRHFPSNYRHVFGIVGMDADFIHKLGRRAPLWGCTNGSSTKMNIAAPSIITASTGEQVHGTSFAAAFATGRFVRYLFHHRGPNPHQVFRNRFLKDTLATQHSDAHYLQAAGECVELTIIK